MASRSNTALQVSVILLVILVAILGVTTYVFYSGQDKVARDLEALQQTAARQQASEANLRFALNLLKRLVGDTEIAEVEVENMRSSLERSDPALFAEINKFETQFDQDMRQFPAGHPAAKNYHTFPAALLQIIKDKSQQNADQQQRIAQLTAEKDTIAASEADKRTKAETARDEALAAQARAEAAALADRQRQETQAKAYRDQLAAKGAELKTALDKWSAERNSLTKDISELQVTVRNKSERIAELTTTSFVSPDGEIVSISGNNVWINIGTADGLQRQTSFSVFDKSETDFENAEPKAMIEVRSVERPKLAQAIIKSDSISNPILPGDIIFSPAWQPGQRVHFALAGPLDLDGDGSPDNQVVRNLITLSGGVVDAEVDEQGRRTGALTLQTRYVVYGEKPTEKSEAGVTGAYSSLMGQVGELGVQKLSVGKFAEMMGYIPESRTQQLGRGAGIEPGAAPKFRSRKPSAY